MSNKIESDNTGRCCRHSEMSEPYFLIVQVYDFLNGVLKEIEFVALSSKNISESEIWLIKCIG